MATVAKATVEKAFVVFVDAVVIENAFEVVVVVVGKAGVANSGFEVKASCAPSRLFAGQGVSYCLDCLVRCHARSTGEKDQRGTAYLG